MCAFKTFTARLSMAAIAIYQILQIVLILREPDVAASWHTISEWVIRHLWTAI